MKKLKEILDIVIFITLRSIIRSGKTLPNEIDYRVSGALIFPFVFLLPLASVLFFHLTKGQIIGLFVVLLVIVDLPLLLYAISKNRCCRIYEQYRNSQYDKTKYQVWFLIYFFSGPLISIAWCFYMLMLNRGNLPEWLIFN